MCRLWRKQVEFCIDLDFFPGSGCSYLALAPESRDPGRDSGYSDRSRIDSTGCLAPAARANCPLAVGDSILRHIFDFWKANRLIRNRSSNVDRYLPVCGIVVWCYANRTTQ